MPAKQTSNGNGKSNGAAVVTLTRQIAALASKTVGQLQSQYRDLAGEPTRTRNKQWLVKRVAFLIQEKAIGGLSERAELQLNDLGARLPDGWRARLMGQAMSPAEAETIATRDPRLPAIGSTLTRTHDGAEHAVTVLAESFVYNGKHYKTLSEIAHEITGTKWNGFRFFNLNK